MKRRGIPQDLVILGGGPAGLVIASVAAQAGMTVTLIEKTGRLGGDCLHGGCVPSKALLHMARLAHMAREGVRHGLFASAPEADFSQAIRYVQSAIDTIQQHDNPQRFRDYGCDVRFGKAVFHDAHSVIVDGEMIHGRRFAVATGSSAAVPPLPGLEEAGYDTNETIFERHELPGRLAVIGGGPAGVELAQAFARLGSRVEIIEQRERLLASVDEHAAQLLQAVLQREGIALHLGCSVSTVRRDGDSRQLQLDNGASIECERILVAAGRRPVVHGLGLEQAGVKFDAGGISTDRRLRTSCRRIFAAGDVCGPHAFTHMAEYQAGVVLANVVFRLPKKVDYRVVPTVVYSDPEIASVGLTPAQATQRGIRYDIAEFRLQALDRNIIDDQTDGFARVLLHRGRIAGATLAGPHAGELIHELALAMQVRARARAVSGLVHAYPTYAQIHRRAINSHYAPLLRSRRVRWFGWLMRQLLP